MKIYEELKGVLMRFVHGVLVLLVAYSVYGFSAVTDAAFSKNAQQTDVFGDTTTIKSTIAPGSLQLLRVLHGSGKFSEVFVAKDRRDNQEVVVKVIKPHANYARLVSREISMLHKLRGTPDVIELKGVYRNSTTGAISLVFPYLGDDATGFLHSRNNLLTPDEIRHYLYRMLTALDRCVALGVMHRDIKPKNVMINRKSGELCLIDFGLSEAYPPLKPLSCKVATRPYKAPELLLGYRQYTPAIDVWASGLLFAGLIFRKMPFIRGKTNSEQLSLVCELVGSKAIWDYCAKYGIAATDELIDLHGAGQIAKQLHTFRSAKNAHWASDDAIDLCGRMLTVDHELRPSCAECLEHPYFDAVR